MTIIANTLEKTAIGNPVSLEQLVMFPLLGPAASEPGYITLDEAIARGVAEVKEVSASGSVPEARFINKGDKPVFLMDGEELIGARQNRVLNLSILVNAHSEVTIPVSCVEAGRWHYESPEFRSAPRTLFAEGRARKADQVSECLVRFAARRSNQSEIWEQIHQKSLSLETHSATGAMDDIYERHQLSLRDYEQAMQPVDGQTGALFFIGSSLISLDLFDCEATLRAMLPKVVQGNALDALDCTRRRLKPPAPTLEQARTFLNEVAAAPVETYPAIGMGQDLRIRGGTLTGGGLDVDGRLVHLYAFRLTEEGRQDGAAFRHTRMMRASRRYRPPQA
jgi:hypothetical protein